MAFSNVSDQELPEGRILFIHKGVAVEGEIVLFRSPNHCPWDVELHVAVLPDEAKVFVLTDNSIYFSREGYVNSIMGEAT